MHRFETKSKDRAAINLRGIGLTGGARLSDCGAPVFGWPGGRFWGRPFMARVPFAAEFECRAWRLRARGLHVQHAPPAEQAAPPPMAQPAIPSQYKPEEVVGRWGYGAFHKDEDLARTAAAARGPMRPAGRDHPRPERRRDDVSRRQRPVAGIAAQGLGQRQELYRPARRCRRRAGPRDRLVRRPHHGAANGWIRKLPAVTAPASMCAARRRRGARWRKAGAAPAVPPPPRPQIVFLRYRKSRRCRSARRGRCLRRAAGRADIARLRPPAAPTCF